MYLKYLTLILFCFGITSLTLAQCPTTPISLTSQADVDNFATDYPGCTMLPDRLGIAGSNPITNLNGLSGLTSIGGDLVIDNAFLPNLDGLSGLTSIGGGLFIDFNDALTNIDGLSGLTSIGGGLYISTNATLTNIDGLSNLTSVGMGIGISFNDALTNIDGLSGLTSIGGGLDMEGNVSLTNLDGLSNVTSIAGDTYIRDNSVLMNLDGLSNVAAIGGDLVLTNNAQLGMCCALCSLLQEDAIDDTVIEGIIDISDNATGCNEAAILACSSCILCDLAVDTQPTDQTTCPNEDATFTLTTSVGVAPLSYQLQNDCAVAGTFTDVGVASTSPLVTISGATAVDACNYRIVVTDNDGCSVTSDVVTLTIDSCPDPEIVPTLSEWGLMILSLITLIIGVVSIREQDIFETVT